LPFCYFELRVGSERLAELALVKKGRVCSPQTLGEHLRNRRLQLGLRQQDVAENLGTLREVYDRWERGDRDQVISEWPAILAFLGYYPFPVNGPADLILRARRVQGADQKRLAGVLGVIHQRLRRWEHGTEPVPVETEHQLKQLAAL
jgi:transcriptional regulator with XRE-family HTH domain